MEAKIDTIYTSERQAMQIMHDGDKENCPIEKYLLQRIATKLTVDDKNKGYNWKQNHLTNKPYQKILGLLMLLST